MALVGAVADAAIRTTVTYRPGMRSIAAIGLAAVVAAFPVATARAEPAGARPGNAQAQANRARNVEKHLARARAFEAEGKHAAAEAQYRAALKIDPNHASARLGLGTARQHQGATGDAIHLFEELIRSEPKLADAYVHLADALYVAGRFADAWEHLHHAEDLGVQAPSLLRTKLHKKHPEPARGASARGKPAAAAPPQNQGKGKRPKR